MSPRTLALALGGLVLVSSVTAAGPQDGADTKAKPASKEGKSAAKPRNRADEMFELDIADRRITEQDFHRETSVEAGGPDQGWDLRVGAAVSALQIDVRLREVHGRVRFRADLEPVLRQLRADREPKGRGELGAPGTAKDRDQKGRKGRGPSAK